MSHSLAIVVGASGGIGGAVHQKLISSGEFQTVWGTSRQSAPPANVMLDLADEDTIRNLADTVRDSGHELRFVFDATGYLHGDNGNPEKSWSQIDAAAMAHQFAINTIGPALLMKHLLPLFPKQGRCVFATISARVGSISDNRLGGWYGYRAAKAALNQMVRTASIELARKRPEAICVALHPGTVQTDLSAPFVKSGLRLQQPDESASAMLTVLKGLDTSATGQLFAYDGTVVPG